MSKMLRGLVRSMFGIAMVLTVLAGGAEPAAAVADCDATVKGTQLNCNLNGTICSVFVVVDTGFTCYTN